MFLFRLLKKNKKSKNSSNVSEPDIAEDTLKAFPDESDEPKKHVSTDPWIPQPTKLTTEVLVKGAADSKPKIKSVKVQEQPVQSFIVTNNTFVNSNSQNRATVPSHAPTTSRTTKLYPDLSVSVAEIQSTSAQTKAIKVKELKSIQDIAQEIVCHIQPTLVHANTITNTLSKFKIDIKKTLGKLSSTRSPLQLEYTFDNELNVMKNYSHIESHEKLHTFNDVKKCHKKVTDQFESKLSNDRQDVSIFLNYRQSFKSYKGQKGDKIICD